MVISPEKSDKVQIFEKWDKEVTLESHSPYNPLLNALKGQNEELYKMACSLTENYKNAHFIQSHNPNICELLNEWLSQKKKIYIKGEDDFQNKKLWNDYIEELWIQLEKDNDRNYWCRRIFPSSLVLNALTNSFTVLMCVLIGFFLIYNYNNIRNSLHSYINKKIRLKHNLSQGLSNVFSRTPSEYGDIHSRKKRINLSYHTS
ncbi:hypothetical protein POCGH01_00202900 [Plasmodium ovale]|uniref:PIR protein n=1 Tax=Plasmodium ovale TaxID=36330 RepID=A0A1D3JF33_PLAOA|nr:hypothetical protein POCGH01_00202900 [Plasmodium ovale]